MRPYFDRDKLDGLFLFTLVHVDPEEGTITIEGTIQWCEDLTLNPMDIAFLAVAYELKSPSSGTWTRQGWLEGWKSLGLVLLPLFVFRSEVDPTRMCRQDNIDGMRTTITDLKGRLASDPRYFQSVYVYTFDLMRSEAQQRSVGTFLSSLVKLKLC
jgi:DCN1-like protein 1/2